MKPTESVFSSTGLGQWVTLS